MFKLLNSIVLLTILASASAEPGHAVAAHLASGPISAPYTTPLSATYITPYAAYTRPYATAFTAPYPAAFSTPYAAGYTVPFAAAYSAPYPAAFTAPLASTSHSHRVDIFSKYNAAVVAGPAKLLTAAPAAAYFAPAASRIAATARVIAPAAALY